VDPSENGEIIVKVFGSIRICILVAVMCALSAPVFAHAQLEATKQQTPETAPEHDGQHDFDFLFGNWKVHCRRLLHPLSGLSQWLEFDGTNVVHRVWDGRANMDEFEADTPSGHIEGMTVRTFSNKSHEWSIYWSTQTNGTVDFPPMVGEFRNGRGEFYDSEMYNGRAIYVRFVWTVSSPDTCHWEQAFSADGGRSWETNFIWDLTREK
jgi:hypothetical protein